MNYYNSIQDGACCPECFRTVVARGMKDGTIVAISESYRTNATMVTQAVQNHIDGLPQDPFIQDGYIDRVILQVADGSDPDYPGIREIIIISASLTKNKCFCSR